MWISNSLAAAIQGPGGRASVHVGMRYLSCTDHYPVSGAISFHRVLMESLKHDHIQGAKLLDFQNDLLSDSALQRKYGS
jgi:hypothetical protein